MQHRNSLRTLIPAVIVVSLAVLGLAGSTPARAAEPKQSLTPARLLPSSDGHLGAWLVAGPIPRQAEHGLNISELVPTKGGNVRGGWWPGFELMSGGTAALDLTQRLQTAVRGTRAIAAATLSLPSDLQGWFLLSADGAASLFIDGEVRWTRDGEHARARSWDAIPVDLTAGDHSLVLVLTCKGSPWRFETRILDRKTLAVPPGLEFVFPGTTSADTEGLLLNMIDFSVVTGLGAWEYRPQVTVSFPRGAPFVGEQPVRFGLRSSSGKGLGSPNRLLGSLNLGRSGIERARFALPIFRASDVSVDGATRLNLDVAVGAAKRRFKLTLTSSALQAFDRGAEVLAKISHGRYPALKDRAVTHASISDRLRTLAAQGVIAGANANWNEQAVLTNARELFDFATLVETGRDPLKQGEPTLALALPSVLDEQPARAVLLRPLDFASTGRTYPLVVVLHGYNGSPERVLDAFLGTGKQRAQPDGFVLAPHAYGNSFYRGAGEANVIQTLDWVLANYPIDRDRVSITGVSMGGTGAAHIALRYPEYFSVAAPLCGYHSFFARRDLRGRQLRPWEHALLSHWSTFAWSENAEHLPFFVAQGTLDLPLENSRVLADRMTRLGYELTQRWPPTGHDVWRVIYDSGRFWNYLSAARRVVDAPSVTIKSDSLRYARRGWARLLALKSPGLMATFHAKFSAADEVIVSTENVESFELERNIVGLLAPELRLTIDGQRLTIRATDSLRFQHRDGNWQTSASAAYAKRVGSEGPIHDAFLGPLAFSYGTLQPGLTRANREVAEAFARISGSDVAYPVVPDTAVTPELEASRSLFLVGSEESHVVLQQLAAKLPIQFRGQAIQLGSRAITGQALGALFIYPNPRASHHYLVVVLSKTVPGLYRALSLPKLLPDFVVYDEGARPASNQQVFDHGYARAAGFFTNQWRLPAIACDPLAATACAN